MVDGLASESKHKHFITCGMVERLMRRAQSPHKKEEQPMGSDTKIPTYDGDLRSHRIDVPEETRKCNGFRIFGKLIQSIVVSTDVAIIRNCNADAVLAVYPFTPQPIIAKSLMMASDIPVFCGIGGGLTTGLRVLQLASNAEFEGAIGVVVNSPTPDTTIRFIRRGVDIPIVVTVANESVDCAARLASGATILNAAAGKKTPWLVEQIRKSVPDAIIMATGGSTPQSILDTINAGADAITWNPPTPTELFKDTMHRYREEPAKPVYREIPRLGLGRKPRKPQ